MISFLHRLLFVRSSLQKSACLILAGLMSVGTPAMAGSSVEIRSTDVTLAQPGLLKGAVLNASAQPVPGVPVHVLHGDTVVASATSDEQGQFSVRGLRHGAHVIQVGDVQQPVRFWGSDAAPPASTSQMAIVVDEDIVRGQSAFNGSSIITRNTGTLLLIGGVTAIVLGTTLGNDDDSPAPPVSP